LATPHSLLVAYGWFVGVGAVATIAVWLFVCVLVVRATRGVPTLRAGAALAASKPPSGRVCVIVPAHNEARVIANLVRSLRAESYRDLAVVLALDRCTDDTAALARSAFVGDERFEIVEIDACPPDWTGKVHALHAGFTRSRGAIDTEYLLFADADTTFQPGCIAASLALMRERSLDLLSLLSTLSYETWFERVVQPAATLELMRQYPLTLANAETGRRPFANGQFLLFRRAVYQDIGGHAAIKDSLFDDVDLARRIDAQKRRGGVFFADGLFHCNMYGDWSQFRRGWKRIFTESAGRHARRLTLSAWRARWLGTLLPLWMLAAAPVGALLIATNPLLGWSLAALGLLAVAIWLGTLARIAALSRAPVWIAPLHIIGAWLTAAILDEAASDLRTRTPTRWGGREYDLGV